MEAPLVFNARDIDEMAGAFTGWQMDVVQQEKGPFQGQLHGYAQLEGSINFYSAHVHRRVFANGHHLEGSVMLTFIDCPHKCIWNGEPVHSLMLLSTDSERGLDVDAGAGFVSYSVSIDRPLLENWLRREGLVLPLNWNFVIDFRKQKRPQIALNFRNLIYRAVYRGEFDLMEFRWSLFELLAMDRNPGPKHLAVNFVPIHDIVEYIHQAIRCGSEINLQDVLDLYGGPMRTFYYNFKKYTGCTPHRYMKNLRLAMTQKLLKKGHPDSIEVRDVAYQFGFRHLGQFSRDYRELFGEVPSQTLKRG